MNSTPEENKYEKHDGTPVSFYFNEPELSLPVLERDEQDKLFVEMNSIKAGKKKQKIRTKIINHNLKLVALISKDYERLGLERADLISEGNFGLMIAVDRFSTKRNCKFSHYAGIWIRQRMMRALVNKGRTIRLPYRVLSLKIAITKFVEAFSGDNGRPPTITEISKKLKVPFKKVKDIESVQLYSSSLNAKINSPDGNNEDVGNLIPDPVNLPADKIALARENIYLLNKFLAQLEPRDKDIVSKRFGVGRNKESTLDEIGSIYGITKERVRQIEEKALIKLRKMVKNEMKIKFSTSDKPFDFKNFDIMNSIRRK